jgi:hypothetical protein
MRARRETNRRQRSVRTKPLERTMHHAIDVMENYLNTYDLIVIMDFDVSDVGQEKKEVNVNCTLMGFATLSGVVILSMRPGRAPVPLPGPRRHLQDGETELPPRVSRRLVRTQ